MAPARVQKKKQTAAAKKKAAPSAEKKPAAARAKAKPAEDPRVAELQKQVRSVNRKLRAPALDLVTKVTLTNQKKDLARRIADLRGDKPFLAKVPKHKQAA